jgi:hypothetical protein
MHLACCLLASAIGFVRFNPSTDAINVIEVILAFKTKDVSESKVSGFKSPLVDSARLVVTKTP